MSGEGSRPPGSFLRMFRESSSGAPGNSEVAKSQGTSSLETRRLRNSQGTSASASAGTITSTTRTSRTTSTTSTSTDTGTGTCASTSTRTLASVITLHSNSCQ